MEAAGADGDFEAICRDLRQYQTSLRTCFTLENFDNLIKNGRMKPIVGTLLHTLGIHVIADATAEGTIHVADKARGVEKTYRAITRLMAASKDCAGAEVIISHCENLEGALALKRADPGGPAGGAGGPALLPGGSPASTPWRRD